MDKVYKKNASRLDRRKNGEFFAIVETLSAMIEHDRIRPLSKEEVKEILNSNTTSFISEFLAFKEVNTESFPDMLLKRLVREIFPEEYLKTLKYIAQLRFWVPLFNIPGVHIRDYAAKIEALKIKYPEITFELRILIPCGKLLLPILMYLIRLFDELILNAVKYSGTKRMIIGVYEQWGELVASVSDFGRGIEPKKETYHIYWRYRSSDPS